MLEDRETPRLDSRYDGENDEVDAGDDGDGVGVGSKEEGESGEEERDVEEGEETDPST